ncbi:complement factor H-related protein 1 [Coregonus clupeaformis]|uniref:complement factor H-related protein 1 n=1 Tax=Coregonus clupeaformis TaxID=59861 RepID=UPI001BDFE919|nr:complement factor H-related protein 1 [Coregonus clupeaformis]
MKEIPLYVIIVLHIWSYKVKAQESGKGCQRPQLDNGFVDPEQEMYQDGMTLTYACDRGLKTPMEGWWGIIKCENGRWSDSPLCKASRSCDAPPQVDHATIVQQYQNKFRDGSIVVYKCKKSYMMEGNANILCLSGEWTSAPTCSDESSPNVRPTARPQPSGPFLPVDRCGAKPTVDNGDFITVPGSNQMALTYNCINYYKLVGPEKVMCRSDRKWSELPTCKAPCTIEKKKFDKLDLPKDMFVKEGASQTFLCKEQDYYRRRLVADVRCQNGEVTIDRCTLGCKLEPRRFHWLSLAQDMFIKEGTHRMICGQTDSYGRPLVADVQCENGYSTSSNCS